MDEYLIPVLTNIVNEYARDYLIGIKYNTKGITITNIYTNTIIAKYIGIPLLHCFPPLGIITEEELSKSYRKWLSYNIINEKVIENTIYNPLLLNTVQSSRYLYHGDYKINPVNSEVKTLTLKELHPEPYIHHVSHDDKYIVVAYGCIHFLGFNKISIYEDTTLIRTLDIPKFVKVESINSNYIIVRASLDFCYIIEWRTDRIIYSNVNEHKSIFYLLDDSALGICRDTIIKRHLPSGTETTITTYVVFQYSIFSSLSSGCIINLPRDGKIIILRENEQREIRVNNDYDYVTLVDL